MAVRYTHIGELQPGHVFEAAWDPDERKLHWLTGGTPPHLQLMDVTVSRNTALPGTEEPKPPLHDLRVLCQGQEFRIRVRADTLVILVPQHHPRCGECGELWPCRDRRLDSAAQLLTHQLDDLCAHCGQQIGGAWSESFHDGVSLRRYHAAKKYRGPDGKPCRAALAEAKAKLPGVSP